MTGRSSRERRAVETVWRMQSARVVGALARFTGDLSLAEDPAQEALAEALVTWPRDGVPRNPVGWLLTVGRRRAVDAFRRRAALDDRYARPRCRSASRGRRRPWQSLASRSPSRPWEERRERLGSVLSVVYLVFTEGASARRRARSGCGVDAG